MYSKELLLLSAYLALLGGLQLTSTTTTTTFVAAMSIGNQDLDRYFRLTNASQVLAPMTEDRIAIDAFTYAFLNYSSTLTNEVDKYFKEEKGRYGEGKILNVRGKLVHVTDIEDISDDTACSPNIRGTNGNPTPIIGTAWIALVRRGRCTFEDKVRNVYAKGAIGVIVYNDKSVDSLEKMQIKGKNRNITAVITYQDIGLNMAYYVDQGIDMTVSITEGRSVMKPLHTVNRTSILFVSVSFIVLMVISLVWLIFYYIQRFRYLQTKDQQSRHLCSVTKKAIMKIPTKTGKSTDEKDADSDCCAICIETYKPSDCIRVLPCTHEFHKNCIDPWLVEHRTCPMCKLDVLKFYGYVVGDQIRTRPAIASSPQISSASLATSAAAEAASELAANLSISAVDDNDMPAIVVAVAPPHTVVSIPSDVSPSSASLSQSSISSTAVAMQMHAANIVAISHAMQEQHQQKMHDILQQQQQHHQYTCNNSCCNNNSSSNRLTSSNSNSNDLSGSNNESNGSANAIMANNSINCSNLNCNIANNSHNCCNESTAPDATVTINNGSSSSSSSSSSNSSSNSNSSQPPSRPQLILQVSTASRQFIGSEESILEYEADRPAATSAAGTSDSNAAAAAGGSSTTTSAYQRTQLLAATGGGGGGGILADLIRSRDFVIDFPRIFVLDAGGIVGTRENLFPSRLPERSQSSLSLAQAKDWMSAVTNKLDEQHGGVGALRRLRKPQTCYDDIQENLLNIRTESIKKRRSRSADGRYSNGYIERNRQLARQNAIGSKAAVIITNSAEGGSVNPITNTTMVASSMHIQNEICHKSDNIVSDNGNPLHELSETIWGQSKQRQLEQKLNAEEIQWLKENKRRHRRFSQSIAVNEASTKATRERIQPSQSLCDPTCVTIQINGEGVDLE